MLLLCDYYVITQASDAAADAASDAAADAAASDAASKVIQASRKQSWR